jgi:hypothetical protein
LCVETVDGPRAWSTFTAHCSCSTATFTVSGERDQPDPEPVLAAVAGLLDQTAPLERAQQAERRRLVHVDLRGHLADPGLAAPSEDFEHGDRPVDGLDPDRVTPTRRVAHDETIGVDLQRRG